jgi:ABC-type branched-subunit amino acid transport system substrate-binding protein
MPHFRRLLRKYWQIALLISLILGACSPAAAPTCPTIRIGIIFNSNDPTTTTQQKTGYDGALQDINRAGIGEGCQVEWIEPQASADTGVDDPQRDVQDLAAQGAVAIIAPPADGGAKRVASMSGFFSIPVVIPADSGDEIIDSGNNNWVFRINPTTMDYASAAFEMVRTSQTNFIANAAIFFESSEYGESAAVAAGQAALRNNISIAIYQRFSPFLEDFKDIQDEINNKHPNVIYLISTQPKQAAAIVQAINGTKDAAGNAPYINYFIASGSAFTNPEFLYDSTGKVNPDFGNLILTLPWAGNLSRKTSKSCLQAVVPATNLGDANPLALNTVQAEVSLRLITEAVRQLTINQTWKVNEKAITNWMEMFTSPENLAIFRQSLAGKIRSLSTCQFGNYLWPISFTTDGQNVLTPVLVKVSGGTLVQVYPQQ